MTAMERTGPDVTETGDHRPFAALSLIFFLSGAAALLFETLWFRLTGLTFGNTAWASAIVLAAFMTGLAAGNALAVRFRFSPAPLRVYATLEISIAVSALLLVFALPATPALCAPLFGAMRSEFALDVARLVLAFALLVIPTTLMGATLPTAVGALSSSVEDFGRILGLLYGMNTLGAVAGALAGELALIRIFGLRGTALIAAACSATASVAAFAVSRSRTRTVSPEHGETPSRSVRTFRLLAAAAGAGFALLALEVIWFRFLILFNFASSVAFAVMLAVVLLGIAVGALVASMLLRSRPDVDRFASTVALVAGVAVILSYWGFAPSMIWKRDIRFETVSVFIDAIRLMFPVSVLSGLFFTAVGKSVERQIADQTRSAALLTCWNTVGAAIGSAVAGFVFLPRLGVERSFLVIAVIYLAVGLLSLPLERLALRNSLVAAAVLVVLVAVFPSGTFRSTFVPAAVSTYLDSTTSIVAVREGLLETAVVLRTDVAGEPYSYKLFTNGYSMSGTGFGSKRYMGLFVYLPVALRPNARSALLISYGVGTTATALVVQGQLSSIDVVDPSRNILALSSTIHPGWSNPLADPRIRVHVEDGRFFLLTTKRRFDLITAEPPPPKSAGIVSLYTLEYFRLLRDRLNDGGIATYWLPVYQLDATEAKSITAAFCGAFNDCSLWSGSGGDWILAGSRGGIRVDEPGFARQWNESGTRLSWLGLEHPGQLAATFLADADGLRAFARGVEPLTDDHPLRLSPYTVLDFAPEFAELMRNAPRSFAASHFIAQSLPPATREEAQRLYPEQQLLDEKLRRGGVPDPSTLAAILTKTDLSVLPRLLLGSDMWLESIAIHAQFRGDARPDTLAIIGIGALASRNYALAESILDAAVDGGFTSAAPYAILSAFMAGDVSGARARIARLPASSPWRDPAKWTKVAR